MRFVFVLWGLLVTLAPVSFLAANPLPEAYPYQLIGSDGFKYRIISDRFSENFVGRDGRAYCRKPTLSVDGSALYDGWKRLPNGQERWIRVSFKQLLEENRLEGAQPDLPDFRSPKDKSGIYVAASAGMIRQVFSEIQKDPARYLQGSPSMTPRKVEVIRRILFEPELVMSREDLKDLSRSQNNPDPATTDFPVDLSGFLPGWRGLIANRHTFEMKRTIQVDEIRFGMAKRMIIFDSEKNRFRVEILADSVSLKGPMNDTGEFIILMNWRNWDQFYSLDQGKISTLGGGKSSGMKMAFDLQFAEEDDQFWLLSIVPQTFTMEFLDKEPVVEMNISGFKDTGEPYEPLYRAHPNDTFETVPLPAAQQKDVQQEITKMISGALASRFFTDGLSVKLPLSVLDQWIRPNRLSPTARLSSALVEDSGLYFGFDMQFDVQRVSDCVGSYDLKEIPARRFDSPRALKVGPRWGLGWAPDQGWELLREEDKNWIPWKAQRTQAEIYTRPEVINRGLDAAWRAGVFCVSTRMWEDRPGHIPLTTAATYRAPQIQFKPQNRARVSLPLEVVQYRRDQMEQNESYSIVENSKRILLETDIEWDLVKGVIKIHDPSFTSIETEIPETEMKLFRDLVSKVAIEIGLAEGEGNFNSLHQTMRLAPSINDWLFKSFSFDSEKNWLSLNVETRENLFSDSKSTVVSAEANPKPLRTVLTSKTDYIVTQPTVSFRWGPDGERFDGRVFYSYRLLQPGEKTALWSMFTADQEVVLPLNKPGPYRFQVKAMNLWYEIEKRVNAEQEFYYEPELQTSNPSVPDWKSPRKSLTATPSQKQALTPSKTQAARRLDSKGPFGCSLHFEAQNRFWVGWVLLVGMFLAVLFWKRSRFRDACSSL